MKPGTKVWVMFQNKPLQGIYQGYLGEFINNTPLHRVSIPNNPEVFELHLPIENIFRFKFMLLLSKL